MKCLSLTQPWATIVAKGLKPVENRKWAPPRAMVGEVFAIHASKTWDKEGERYIREAWDGYDPIEEAIGEAVLVRSAILGVARLVGWMSFEEKLYYTVAGDRVVAEPGHRLMKDPWFFGPYGFVLEDVRELREPIPCKGALNFWRMPSEIEAAVVAQLGRP
jgi:hypothetical protein